MKNFLKYFLTLTLFFAFTFGAFAMSTGQELGSDLIVTAITPLATWLATWVLTKFWSKIPTSIVFVAVAALSWVYTQAVGIYEAGESSYFLQIIAGFGSVFLNEILKSTGARQKLSALRTK